MTRNRKLLLAGAALAVIAAGGAAAIARHGPHGWGPHSWGHHGWGHDDGPMGMGAFMGGPGMGGPGGRFCHGDGSEMADHMLVRIEHQVKPTEAQKANFEDLKTAARSAASKIQAACPKDLAAAPPQEGVRPPIPTPIERLDRAQAMAEATLDALKTVRPAAEKFYISLSDEQKAQLNEQRHGWGGGWRHHGGRDGEQGRGPGGDQGRGPGGDHDRGPGGEPGAPPRN